MSQGFDAYPAAVRRTARAAAVLGVLLACHLAVPPRAGGAPQPELGRPWIDGWSIADYPANSHQNWSVRLDAEGRVWVANGSGAQLYDGERWRLIRMPQGTLVYALLPAEDGRVYLGTTADIGYLEPDDHADWRFVSLLEGRDDVPSFANVLNVGRTSDGVFFQAYALLLRYRPETGELSWYRPQESFRRMQAAGDTLYIGNRGSGIDRYDRAADRLVHVPGSERFAESGLAFFSADREGRLVVGGSRGLFRRDGDGFTRVPTAADDWLARTRPYEGRGLADGGLAIASRDDGIVVLDPDGGMRRHFSRPSGLRWSWVTDLEVDRQGGMWLTQDGGISRVELSPALTYFDEPLGVHGVEALTRHRGRLIAATVTGLQQLAAPDRPGGQTRFVPLAAEGTATWSLLDTGESLLYGHSGGGISLLRLDDGGAATTRPIYPGSRAVRLARSRSDPDVVYGALEDGVVRIRRDGDRWRSEGKLEGVDFPVVFVEEGADGSLWFGTTGGGYYRVRSVAGWPRARIERFGAEAGVPAGNAHLFRNGDELLYGTWDGFRRFAAGRFEVDPRFPPVWTEGTRDIHRMAEVGDGRLWVYGGGVVALAVPRAGGGYDLDERPLAQLEPQKVSALHVDPDGVLWLGGRSGVVRFDPAAWSPPVPLPPVRVARVSVPGEAAPLFAGAASPAPSALPPLSPGRDALRIEYALADYSPPHRVEYRVRLDGVDRGWSDWSGETRKDYTNLPPGRHTFRVEARNGLGQTAEEGRLVLHLLPPWYRTWAAYAVYAALALGLLFASVRFATRQRTVRLETERRRLEAVVDERTQEIRRQAEELEALHRAKSRFFTNVSHELRTPLTLTLGPLEDAVSGRNGPLPEEVGGSLAIALRSARRLRNLVDQVLDVERLEAGKMPVAAAPGDLANLVRRAAARFAAAAERADLELDLSAVEDAAGGAEAGRELWFDAALMERVVDNLLANALKYTPRGGRVTVSLARRVDQAVLAVRDTGIGIAGRDLERVFDRYYQADRTVVGQPGTGIGLALVRELVELHGGTVGVDSEPGVGSTFTLRLPLGRQHLGSDQLAAAPGPEPQRPPLPAIGDGDREVGESAAEIGRDEGDDDSEPDRARDATTLLIVDDNAELRGFLRQRFAGRYRVLEAADGSEAVELCRRNPPDLVICDVMMPRMDGFEVARILKADPELDFIPLLLLTARATTEDAVTGLGAGADDYLRKPFDAAELEARVERLIASRRLLRARFAAPEAVDGASASDAAFDRRLLAAIEVQLAAGELSVQSLADALAMDRTHLYRRVQAIRETSPQALIRRIRLQTAARMLAHGEGTVSQIAYCVGYNSLGHFSESFRRHFGVSPSKWQRQDAVTSAP